MTRDEGDPAQTAGERRLDAVAHIPRVVLAGGRVSPEMAAQIGGPIRAAALFNNRRLIDIVLGALEEADPAAQVTVVGDLETGPSVVPIKDHGDFVSNVLAGVARHATSEWVIVTSADMPFLSAAIISHFLEQALTIAGQGVDLVYPVVPVSACYAKYPGIKRTAVRLREGELTGGNLMLARPMFFLDRRDLLARTYAARKHPFRLAAMLGLGTVTRLLVSQLIAPQALTIAMLEERVGRLVQGQVRALVSKSPELATDLDRPSDFAIAESIMSGGPVGQKS